MERSTVGSLLRSTQALCSQLCDKQTLSHGIAYYSERFAKLPEANQFREVVAGDPAECAQAFSEAERWFAEVGLRCLCWAPAGGQASDELAGFLIGRGLERRTSTAMVLSEWVKLEPDKKVRIVHARAVRAALRATFLETESLQPGRHGGQPLHSSDTAGELLANACEERLNDPQFDMFVALVDGQPAGRCALYQVGDVARVMDLSVLAPFADRGADRALTAHVLALAKRLSMRNICLQVDDADADLRSWFEQAGFVADGHIDEFDRPPTTISDETP